MQQDDYAEDVSADSASEQRSYGTLGTILLVIVVIVIILLFWRGCGSTGEAGESSGGGGVIEKVEGLEVVDGGVAIWLASGSSLDEVLARHGLSDAGTTSLGDGTYVISIGSADPAALVRDLKADPGLLDAGFLYTEQ